jgi:formyl-CoA transferase
VIGAGNDNLFQRVCGLLDHPEWATDERFVTNPLRVQHRAEIESLITDATSRWTTVDLEAKLLAHGVPCSAIRTLDKVAADEQTAALGMLHEVTEGSFAGSPVVGLPMTFGGKRPLPVRSASKLGEETAAILESLGLTHENMETDE